MSLLNMSSLREMVSGLGGLVSTKREAKKASKSEKLQRHLALDSLEARVLLSVNPTSNYDVLVNTMYSENQSTETNGTTVAIDEDGDIAVVWTRGDNIYRDQNRNVGWYDVDGNLVLYTDRNFIDQSYTSDLPGATPIDVVLTPYTDPDTGAALIDSNIYARYFTDEVQRLTIDTNGMSDGEMLHYLTVKTGDTCVQTLHFTSTDTLWEKDMPFIYTGTFSYQVGNSARTVEFEFNDVANQEILTPYENAKSIQEALEGIFGEGNVEVTPISRSEFTVAFKTTNVANEHSLLQFTVEEDDIVSGVLPSCYSEWNFQPAEVQVEVAYENEGTEEDPIWGDIDVNATAANFITAFKQYQTSYLIGGVEFVPPNQYGEGTGPTTGYEEIRTWDTEISVLPVLGLEDGVIGFDITFINADGKQDVQQMTLTEAVCVNASQFDDAFGEATKTNDLALNSSFVTLKQSSGEIRVNPTTDEKWSKKSKIYQATAQTDASVAMDPDGDFVVSWTGEVLNTEIEGSFTDVFARTITPKMYQMPDGTAIEDLKCYEFTSDAIRVNSTTPGEQYDTACAMDKDGNYVIAWASKSQDQSYFNAVYMQRYDRNGNRLGSEERVDTEVTGTAICPQIALSPDGTQIAVTWNWVTGTHFADEGQDSDLYLRLYGYSTDANNVTKFVSLIQPTIIGKYGYSSVQFNRSNQFVVAWNSDDGDDNDATTNSESVGVHVRQYYWEANGSKDLTVGALQTLRNTFRANSASFDAGSVTSWLGDQSYPRIAIDADGDITVGYNGFGLDTAENVIIDATMLTYFDQLINDDLNADLLPFFSSEMMFIPMAGAYTDGTNTYGTQMMWMPTMLEQYIINSNPDSIIQTVLARAEGMGATAEQVGRLGTILNQVFKYSRGNSAGVFYSQFDASDVQGDIESGNPDLLNSDSVVSSTRDGEDAKCYLEFCRAFDATNPNDFIEDTTVWETMTCSLTNAILGARELTFNVVYEWVNGTLWLMNVEATRLNIEQAIQNAIGNDPAWSEAMGYESSVEVRALFTGDARVEDTRFYDDTSWDLNDTNGSMYWRQYYMQHPMDDFETYPDTHACFEITFAGNYHDTPVSLQMVGSTVRQAECRTYVLEPGADGQTYFFRLQHNGTVAAQTIIAWNGNNWEAVRGQMAAAMEELGYPMPSCKVNIDRDEDGNPISISITLTGDRAGEPIDNLVVNTDTPMTKDADGNDVPDPKVAGMRPIGADGSSIFLESRTPGMVINDVPFNLQSCVDGDFGTVQDYMCMDMEGDGDFTVVWTQYDRDGYTPTLMPIPNPVGNTSNIYFRTFNEENDACGPEVVDMIYKDGTKIESGKQIVDDGGGFGAVIVTFSEEMMDDTKVTTTISEAKKNENHLSSITNIENWTVMRDGEVIADAIIGIYFGMNRSADDDMQALGVTALAENKWEAVLVFNPDVDMSEGTYQIILDNAVRDVVGNPLGSTGIEQNGDSFTQEFDVIEGSSETEVVTPEVDDEGNPIRDDEGNVIEKVGDQELTDTDSTDLWSPTATASDYEGDTVTVWSEAGAGIFAHIDYRKWENDSLKGRTELDDEEGDLDIQITDDATAYFASVDMDGSGNFVVTWTQNDGEGGLNDWNVWAQLFDLNGEALTEAFRVNTTTVNEQKYSQVAMSLSGDFMITWQGYSDKTGTANTGWDVYAQRYDCYGNPIGAVNDTQAINITDAWTGSFRLTFTDKDGQYYESEVIDFKGNTFSIIDQIQKELDAFQVPGLQFTAQVTSATQIVIVCKVTDNSERDVPEFQIRVEETTSKTGGIQLTTLLEGAGAEFMVNQTTANNQKYASIACDYEGNFIVSWTGYGQDGDTATESNIYARQFYSNQYLATTTNSYMSYITSPKDPADIVTNAATGVCLVSQNLGTGTGSLLATGCHVLTAAHVVCDENAMPVTSVECTFYLEDGSAIVCKGVPTVHPGYLGTGATSDIAVITLDRDLTGIVEIYDINRNDSLGVGSIYTRYGYGQYGTGEGTEGWDGQKRVGQNKWEALGSDIPGIGGSDLLVYDFDDGTPEGDELGAILGVEDLGLGEDEACGAHGDSGGPCFVNGVIVGICTGGYSDFSEFGTIGIDTRVSVYSDWIDELITDVTAAAGDEFLVNDEYTAKNQKWSDVAVDADGDFVITWTSAGQDGVGTGYGADAGGLNGVFARRYAADGTAASGLFDVSTTKENNQQLSKVDIDADGDFVIVWESFQEHGNGTDIGTADNWGVYAQRYVATGKQGNVSYLGPNGEIGGEFRVNTRIDGNQRVPSIALTHTGDIFVAWQSDEQGTEGIYSKKFLKADDDTGSVVVRVVGSYVDKDGADASVQIQNGDVLTDKPTELVITFGEQMVDTSTNATNSILNLNNWVLTKDGVIVTTEIIDHIEIIGYDQYDPAYVEANGGTCEKDIYRVVFKDGVVLEDGVYVVSIRDRVEDGFGNLLDGNGDGVSGGGFNLGFEIDADPDDGGSIKPNPNPGDADDENPDTPVSESNIGGQYESDVAARDNGDYVVVWKKDLVELHLGNEETDDNGGENGEGGTETEGDGYGDVTNTVIVGQRYNRYGEKIGAEFQISDLLGVTGEADGQCADPQIAMDAYGNYVVTWTVSGRDLNLDGVHDNNENAVFDIYCRIYNAYGEAMTKSFLVTEGLSGQKTQSAVAIAPNGENFVVSWTNIDTQNKTDDYSIHYKRYDFSGSAYTLNGVSYGEDFLVNVPDTYHQCNSTIAMDNNGNVTVAWQSSSSSATGVDIFARRFNNTNDVITEQFRVNTIIVKDQNNPDIAMNDNGDCVIAWASQSGKGYDIYYRCFDSDLNPLCEDQCANSYQYSNQTEPSVSMTRRVDKNTEFAISWTSYGQEPNFYDSTGVFMNIYDGITTRNSVTSAGTEIRVNSLMPGDEFDSAIAMDAYGNVVASWTGPNYDVMTGFATDGNNDDVDDDMDGIIIKEDGTILVVATAMDENGDLVQVLINITDLPHTDIFNRVYIRRNVEGYSTSKNRVNTSAAVVDVTKTVSANSLKTYGGGTITNTNSSLTIQAAAESNNKFTFAPKAAAGTDSHVIKLNDVAIAVNEGQNEFTFDALAAGSYNASVIVQGEGGESVSIENNVVTILGADYKLTIRNAKEFLFLGTGDARVNVTSTGTGELFEASGTYASLVTSKASYRVEGCNSVVATSTGSMNTARLLSGVGADTFTADGNGTFLRGDGYSVQVIGYASVSAYGGENDKAVLRPTAGKLSVYENAVSYTAASTAISASGFASVDVQGSVAASITTSATLDVVQAGAGLLTITNDELGFAQSFAGLTAISMTGAGNDSVTLTENAATLSATPNSVTFGSYTLKAIDDLTIHANGASVQLGDSAGNDTLVVDGTSAILTGADYSLNVDGFSALNAVSSLGGNDSATLYDTTGNDSVTFAKGLVTLNAGLSVGGYTNVEVLTNRGGSDVLAITGSTGADEFLLAKERATAKIDGKTYTMKNVPSVTLNGNGGADVLNVYDSKGNDTFDLAPGSAHVYGEGYDFTATNVAQTNAFQLYGGNDSVNVKDSEGDDTLLIRPEWMTLNAQNGKSVTVSGFATLDVRSLAGNDTAVMYDSQNDDTLTVTATTATFEGAGFFNRIAGFRKVNAYASFGGNDHAVYDSIFTLTENGKFAALDSDDLDVNLLAFERLN